MNVVNLGRKSIKKPAGTLADLANWDVKTIQDFNNLQISLDATPSSKMLISSMIKFEEMYQPLAKNPRSFDPFGKLEGINESRRAQRARTYLHHKDLLKSADTGGGKKLILTTRAHKIFYQEYPLAKLAKLKWDGNWTIVMYDFPETRHGDRNYFREKLMDLGFGLAQQSVLVSPLPLQNAIQELVDGEKMDKFVWVLTAQRVLGLSNKEVAATAWKLTHLNDLYSKLTAILPIVKKRGSHFVSDWRKHFLAVSLSDPCLPDELLPGDWQGETCRKEFIKLGLPGLLQLIFAH